MDSFNSAALKLQRNLLELRHERDRLSSEGKDKEAERLADLIAQVEAAIRQLPDSLMPSTLQ